MAVATGKCAIGLAALLLSAAPPQPASADQPTAAQFGAGFVDGAAVPWKAMTSGAVKYRSKTFALPTGTIRILEFRKADGGVRYRLGSEKEFYVVAGSVQADIKDRTETLAAGDTVNLPTGTLTSPPDDARDTTLILYTVPNASKTPVGGAVFSKDAKQALPPPAPAKDGGVGAAISIKTYGFDGNSVRVIAMTAPGTTPVTTHEADSIVYMLSGRMKLTLGSETRLIKAGDAVREPAGVPSYWEVIEDSTFVSTSAAFAAK